MPLHTNGRCSGRVLTEGRLEPRYYTFTGHRETGCLSMPAFGACLGLWLGGVQGAPAMFTRKGKLGLLSLPLVAARECWLPRGPHPSCHVVTGQGETGCRSLQMVAGGEDL